MRRPYKYCLSRQIVKMSWNPQNCYNLIQRKPLNERHLNMFQLEWKSKTQCRGFFNGDVTERVFRKAFNDNKRNIALTLGRMERRADNVVFRSLFASSIFSARKLVSSGCILVNGQKIKQPSRALNDGDILQVAPASFKHVQKLTEHPLIRLWGFTPAYLEVDYLNLATVFLKQPQLHEIPHPFPKNTLENFAAFYSKRG